MTDARFLSNDSVNCKANHVKFERLARRSLCIKTLNNCRNRSMGSPLRDESLPKKVKILHFKWPRSHARAPIGVKFRTTKHTHVPLGCSKFYVNRCNELPLRGDNVDVWSLSKNIPAVCRLAAMLPVITLNTFRKCRSGKQKLSFPIVSLASKTK